MPVVAEQGADTALPAGRVRSLEDLCAEAAVAPFSTALIRVLTHARFFIRGFP